MVPPHQQVVGAHVLPRSSRGAGLLHPVRVRAVPAGKSRLPTTPGRLACCRRLRRLTGRRSDHSRAYDVAISQKAATARTAEPPTVVSPSTARWRTASPRTIELSGSVSRPTACGSDRMGCGRASVGTASSRLQDRAMAHGGLSLPGDIASARAPARSRGPARKRLPARAPERGALTCAASSSPIAGRSCSS